MLLRTLVAATLALGATVSLAAQQSSTTVPNDSGGQTQQVPVRHVTIDWAAVEGAIGYRVLVRPLGGDVTIDERSTATSIQVELRPGTYQVRVVSFNIFNKPASVSKWRDINVIHVFRPVVKLLSPKVLYAGLPRAGETIDGLHYLPETTVALTRDGAVVARATIDQVRDDQLTTHFDLLRVKPGSYDLRLTNPEHLVLVMKKAIEVRPRIQPRLNSISLRAGYNDRAYRDVTVRGGGFVPGTSFFLDRDGHRIEVPNVTIHSRSHASVDLNLGSAAPGSYDLVAANPGGKVTRLRSAVTVVNISTPVFESMSPESFTIGESPGVFALRAKAMIPDAQVYLRRNGQLTPTVAMSSQAVPTAGEALSAYSPTPATPVSGGSSSVRLFRIDLSSIEAGRYDLVIANSQLLRTVVAGAVTVKPKPIPRLVGSSVTNAYDTLEYKNVVLRGVNLKPSFGVVLKNGSVEHDLVSRFISPDRVSVDIDFRGMSPGTYSVLVQNSGHVVASLPGGILVTSPRKRFIHPSAPAVMLGYPYGLVLSPSFANAVSVSLIAGRLVADFPLGVKFFPNLPGVRDVGIGLEVGYSLYDGAATGSVSGATSSIGMTRPGINLYYRTPFNFPLNGYLTAGYGLSLSQFHSTSATATLSGSSIDFYFRLGAGAELDLGKWIVLQGGADWLRVLYAATNLDALEIYLRTGVRFGP